MRGQRDKVTFSPRGVAASFIIVMAALLFSCGLPTSEYLYPPVEFSQTSANLVVLYHNSNNVHDDNGFNGYKIYYRVFDDYDNAYRSWEYLSKHLTSSNVTSIASSKDYYFLLKETSDGTSYDYSTLIPYSVCESGTYDYFALNMNSTTTWTITGSSSAEVLSYVVRNKGSSTTDSSDADFCVTSNYVEGDQDYDGTRAPVAYL
ncbi:MAG: hypothetical protein SAMD01599839_04820 [Rectinema sp.]